MAAIVVLPLPIAVTKPSADTVATSESSAVQVTAAATIVLPPESTTVAVRRSVSPSTAREAAPAESVSDDATCCTVAVMDALADPDVTVTVATPLPTAVTRPASETVATDSASDTHVSSAPLIRLPSWSSTVTLSCSVCPSAENETLFD
jgi:hypothetical protein